MKKNNIQKMPKAGQAGNGTKPHVGGSCRAMKMKIFPPNHFEFHYGNSVQIGAATSEHLGRFAVKILKDTDNPIYEFAVRVAKAMNEIKSSNVYFIMQQAYGEIDWSEVEGIFSIIAEYEIKSNQKMK